MISPAGCPARTMIRAACFGAEKELGHHVTLSAPVSKALSAQVKKGRYKDFSGIWSDGGRGGDGRRARFPVRSPLKAALSP
jgi:hypothetical protein